MFLIDKMYSSASSILSKQLLTFNINLFQYNKWILIRYDNNFKKPFLIVILDEDLCIGFKYSIIDIK